MVSPSNSIRCEEYTILSKIAFAIVLSPIRPCQSLTGICEVKIIEAERLSHDLTLHFGVLSSSCKDESEYIEKSKNLAEKMLQIEDYKIEDLLFGNVLPKDRLDFTLKKIIGNIEELKKIPMKNRHYDF